MTGRESRFTWLVGAALCAGAIGFGTDSMASPIDHLTDLTGKVTVIVTLTGRDNFTSEYRYDVSVRNVTAEPLIADSLIVVLDKITNLAGEDHEGLTNEPFLNRFDVLGQDGETGEGKPFFRIPPNGTPDVAPQTNSRAASVRIRNRDYVAVFTPVFKVYGNKRPLPEAKQPAAQTQPAVPHRQTDKQIDKLLQLLLKKGVITEEEWRKANQP
ncbi:MAG: hypothetical protein LZF86_110567 [Nitrospira sp.]|nr:MAG: hypothetical protein LZF86_110567 [Nitrospira sp.]